jgi:hypothetical protein
MIKKNIALFITLITIIFFPFLYGTVHAQSSVAKIGVFDALTVAPDAIFEVPIIVEEVSELYAIDFEMTFDPNILEAQDGDPNMPGVQLGFGDFLDPGLLLFNTVDNEQGKIRLAMTQANPSEPKSGSGILFVIYFKALQSGESELSFTNLQTASRKGELIESEAQNSQVKVDPSAPDVEATAIPVINPTAQIIIPTAAPTEGAADPSVEEETPVETSLPATEVPPSPTATQIPSSPTATQAPPNPTATEALPSPTATQALPSDTPAAEVVNNSPTVMSTGIESTQVALNQSEPTAIAAEEIVAQEHIDIDNEVEQKVRFQLSQYWWVVLLFALLFMGIVAYALITIFVKKSS